MPCYHKFHDLRIHVAKFCRRHLRTFSVNFFASWIDSSNFFTFRMYVQNRQTSCSAPCCYLQSWQPMSGCFRRSSGGVRNRFAFAPRTALSCRWDRLFRLTSPWALLCLFFLWLRCWLGIVLFGWFGNIGFLLFGLGFRCNRSLLDNVPILLSFSTITVPLTHSRGWRETWMEKLGIKSIISYIECHKQSYSC